MYPEQDNFIHKSTSGDDIEIYPISFHSTFIIVSAEYIFATYTLTHNSSTHETQLSIFTDEVKTDQIITNFWMLIPRLTIQDVFEEYLQHIFSNLIVNLINCHEQTCNLTYSDSNILELQ